MSVERRYKPGDKVRIVGITEPPWTSLNGTVTTVTAGPVRKCTVTGIRYGDGMQDVYELALPYMPRNARTPKHRGPQGLQPRYLEPYRDDDRFEPGSWSEVEKLTGWKPQRVGA